jgi:hypothetical protein
MQIPYLLLVASDQHVLVVDDMILHESLRNDSISLKQRGLDLPLDGDGCCRALELLE